MAKREEGKTHPLRLTSLISIRFPFTTGVPARVTRSYKQSELKSSLPAQRRPLRAFYHARVRARVSEGVKVQTAPARLASLRSQSDNHLSVNPLTYETCFLSLSGFSTLRRVCRAGTR